MNKILSFQARAASLFVQLEPLASCHRPFNDPASRVIRTAMRRDCVVCRDDCVMLEFEANPRVWQIACVKVIARVLNVKKKLLVASLT